MLLMASTNIGFWKDHVEQHENQGRIRTFKKFETNLNFEEYLNEISSTKHRQTQNPKYPLRLPVESGAITIFL